MELFKQVPSNFFGILASPNKEIYLQALMTLYEAFETDLSIKRSELIIYLIDQLDELVFSYTPDEAEAEELKEKSLGSYAHLILRKLKDTGWIELEMGLEDFQEYISIPDYAFQIIRVLYQITSDSLDTEYNRYVYSTYSVLKTSSEEGQNYKTAIDSAFDQTKMLFDKLKMLYNNIRRYHRQLADHRELNKILIEHFDAFKANLSDKIYYPIKTFDSVHRFKTPILGILKDWLYDDEIMTSMADEEWMRVSRKGTAAEQAFKEKIQQDAKEKLVKVIDIYESMDQLLKEIDKKNSEYTKAIFDRIDFLLNTDRSVKGKVRELIKVLSSDSTDKWHLKIARELDISPQMIVDEGSLYASRKARERKDVKREKVKAIVDKSIVLSEAEAFKETVHEAYSKRSIQQYMMALLDDSETIDAAMIPIEDDGQYIKTILGVLDNDDKKSKYGIAFKDGEIDKQKYRIPDFKVKRKAD
jgi:hypothetical protein